MVVACVALSVALAGSAVAGTQAVKTAITKKQAKKIAKRQANKQITKRAPDLSVSHAETATSASSADTAKSANAANTAASASVAEVANDLAPSEAFHEVGAGGEPPFQNGCVNASSGVPAQEYQTVGFYKDKLGVVHLKGLMQCPTMGVAAFQLPAGYRPPENRVAAFAVVCNGCGTDNTTGSLNILGAGTGIEGGVLPAGTVTSLEGVTFRAGG